MSFAKKCQIVFPVKYRKALLEVEVVKIIEETTTGIQERYAIEMETLGDGLRAYSYSPGFGTFTSKTL